MEVIYALLEHPMFCLLVGSLWAIVILFLVVLLVAMQKGYTLLIQLWKWIRISLAPNTGQTSNRKNGKEGREFKDAA